MPRAHSSQIMVSPLCAWLLSVAFSPAAEYEVIDLGTLGGVRSEAFGLNDRSQVVGAAQDADGRTQAFLWQNGTMTGLGFLPGGTSSVAQAINNQGKITGYADVSPTNRHAFLYFGGTMASLGTLGGPNSVGRAINEQGDVTGSSRQTVDNHNHTFVWRAGQLIHITPYHNFYSCDAFGINEAGQACGITALWATNDRWWGYVWFDANTNGLHDAGEMIVLGSLGVIYSVGSLSSALALNEVGQVVGFTGITNTWWPHHAFLITSSNGQWKIPAGSPNPTNSLMRDLGVLGGPTNNSYARAINNQAWIVGNADLPDRPNQAFLWRNGAMTNLNDLIAGNSGWVLTNATGINEHNEIVGSGFFNGQARAYLLRCEGRITRVEPVVQTNWWIATNEFGEVVTQAVEHIDTQVLHWAGIWGSHTSPVFTVEYCDDLPTSNWVPSVPTSQWPIAGNFWTNPALNDSSRRFFRVRAE